MVRKPPSLAFALTITALLLGASSTPAQAYLDPGTGSILLQALLGGAAGAAVVGRRYWHRLMVLVGARRDAPEAGNADGATGQAGQAAGQSKPQAD